MGFLALMAVVCFGVRMLLCDPLTAVDWEHDSEWPDDGYEPGGSVEL